MNNHMAKKKVTLSLNEDLLNWAKTLVEKNVHYSSLSHLVEVALTDFKKKLEDQGRE